MSFSGRCLCGAVTYRCDAEPVFGAHCHCEDCRRSAGTGHSSILGVPKDAFSISGSLSAYTSSADSGNAVTRHFCPTCGAPVTLTVDTMPQLVFLRASSLDDMEVFKPQFEFYTARRASWDAIDPSLQSFEKMPPK